MNTNGENGMNRGPQPKVKWVKQVKWVKLVAVKSLVLLAPSVTLAMVLERFSNG